MRTESLMVGVGVGASVVLCCLRQKKSEASKSVEVIGDCSGVGEETLEQSMCAGDARFRETTFGALSTRVFPEPQESKDKKLTQIAGIIDKHYPLSRVRAVPVAQAPHGAKVKIVTFVRHGEGTSNSAARLRGREQYKSSEWLDARLTELGKKQARDISQYVFQKELTVDVVAVSPLRRATETACIAFSSINAPFVATELLRERSHGNPCDQRKPRSQLQNEFPAVDFASLPELDPLSGSGADSESWLDTAKRAHRFVDWLADRPEARIAVATHSAFLLTLFRIVLVVDADTGLEEWFETGELRSVALIFPDGEN